MKTKFLAIFAFSLFALVLLSGCTNQSNNPGSNGTINTSINGSKNSSANISAQNESSFQINPIQCNGNPWDKWYAEGHVEFIKAPTQEQLIKTYYAHQGIEITNYSRVNFTDAFVCAACTCPAGYTLYVTATGDNLMKIMADDGWQQISSSEIPSPETASTGGLGGGAGMANPASVNCIQKGFNLTMKTDANGGQYGVCSGPGYSECEEWAFFRGECNITKLGQ